jgi:hypothetical protein
MGKFIEDYRTNYDAITASTKGAAPAIHVLWSAVALTIFEVIEAWVVPTPVKRMHDAPKV